LSLLERTRHLHLLKLIPWRASFEKVFSKVLICLVVAGRGKPHPVPGLGFPRELKEKRE